MSAQGHATLSKPSTRHYLWDFRIGVKSAVLKKWSSASAEAWILPSPPRWLSSALGSDNVIGVLMPSQFSSQGSIDDAVKLARNLEIAHKIIPIEDVFETYQNTLKTEFKGLPSDSTEENMQARIRGNILMALSNKYGYLVLTTGNKSELAVGYCTLYGDMRVA